MTGEPQPSVRESFSWIETEARLRSFVARWPDAAVDDLGRCFEVLDGHGVLRARFVPPAVVPAPQSATPLRWLSELPEDLGVEVVLLLQAGASALALFGGDELLTHKASKKYVVRGSGRAQPTHLKTRGKSRYGSRLRLQNARALLVEVNEHLIECWHEHGRFDRLFYSCPKRTWPELFAARPAPPMSRDDPMLCRIPLDVHVPTFAEVTRVRQILTHGRVELFE